MTLLATYARFGRSEMPLQLDDCRKAIILMGKAGIRSMNVIQRGDTTFDICRPASSVSCGPWIPIMPDSQEGPDLSEQWAGEDDD